MKYRNASISRSKLTNAITKGDVKREFNCHDCESDKNIQAHHNDYNKPMNVIWLCSKCHSIWHKNNTPLNREFGIFNKKQTEK